MTTPEARNVVITVDGSEHSIRAFNWYVTNLMKSDIDTVHCLHIPEHMPLPVLAAGPGMYSPRPDACIIKDIQNRQKKIEEIGHAYEAKLKEHSIKGSFHCEESDGSSPGHSICEYIKKHKANVVVMGNRGLGALRRTFLGSVSDYVIHHANIPVVIVPPQK